MTFSEIQRGLYDMVSVRKIEITDGKWTNLNQIIYHSVMLGMIFMSIIPLMFVHEYPIFTFMERVAVSAFILDYFLRWLVAGARYESKVSENPNAEFSNKKKVWAYIKYPFTIPAIIDLLSILPGLYLINKSFVLVRFVRIFKIFRVFKFIPYFDQITLLLKVIKDERKVLMSVFLMAVFYIVVTAMLMFNSEPHDATNSNPNSFHCFFDALYWATGTLTTVGAGDLGPVTEMGRIISMFSSIFGVAIIAMPSGAITARYVELLRKKQKEEDEKAKVQNQLTAQPEETLAQGGDAANPEGNFAPSMDSATGL